jgi:hypothetical protein
MFPPTKHVLAPSAIDALLTISGSPTDDNDTIPAGYTYLGQFVDHDITFDPTSQLGRANDPRKLTNFRTPRFDLDSVYGAGPAAQPYLYEWTSVADRGVKLLVGRSSEDGRAVDDLPRNPQGLALAGDPRNEENLIVAQLHLLFVQAHNRVVDRVRSTEGLTESALFARAQEIVREHYQWIVMHDFLRRLVGAETARSVLVPGDDGETVVRSIYHPQGQPFIPVEFSAAAYRCGHSMVRADYRLNDEDGIGTVPIFDDRADPRPLRHLAGFRPLPVKLQIDWRNFYELPGSARPQSSRLIDPNIAAPLRKLPAAVNAERKPLALLNLQRAQALELPSGKEVAQAMGLPALSDEELLLDQLHGDHAQARGALSQAPPLWYYVLCEARSKAGGEHLGPLGGRIVAEVLAGLLEADRRSYLHQPDWRPTLPREDPADFTMPDLVRFAQGVT